MNTAHPPEVRVLVLEEDDDLRDAILDALAAEGFVAEGVATVKEALATLKSAGTDAVLIDLRLTEGEGGLEVIAPFADDEAAPAMVILSSTTEHVDPLVAEFNLPWLRKPFDLDVLIAAIRTAVGSGARPRRSKPVEAA